ncbi:uncharacterized protein ACA1_399840 [Acanthamoeba castellanii str. Neff]|uniref:Uncharacterized protein n=1 Tax=Acanthamoeba castellanii (strain ATCC 30010 / Neff) TaxID=1257118 RepID=L8GFS2_ACACF|nr:uncharacterized protein ACA1_399840 [Acanthamoeba castellanii str. Neff]ELR11935.1 hypothetical protein ACA1_399840 [Acanthamoeba castellanii str. Neff]
MRTATAYPPSPLSATLQRSSRIGTVVGVAALVYVLYCLGTAHAIMPPPNYTNDHHLPAVHPLPPVIATHLLPHGLQAVMGTVLHLHSIDAPPSPHASPVGSFTPRAIARVTLTLKPDFGFHIRSTFNSGSGRWRVSGQHNITFGEGAWTEMAPSCDNTQGEELVLCHQRLTIEELLYDAFGRDHELSLTFVPSVRQFILTDRRGLCFVFRIPLEPGQ